MDTASKFVRQASGWGTMTYITGILLSVDQYVRLQKTRLLKSWNTVFVALRSTFSIIVIPFQCLSHWSLSSRAVHAEEGHTDTGCPSCHPHSAAAGRSHYRKDTSQHLAPGSAAGPVHDQTHGLPLVGDLCLNITAKDKGRVTVKSDNDRCL